MTSKNENKHEVRCEDKEDIDYAYTVNLIEVKGMYFFRNNRILL